MGQRCMLAFDRYVGAMSESDWRDVGERRRAVVMAGYLGHAEVAVAATHDDDPSVRVVALGALQRLGELTVASLETALTDHPRVARRAAELAANHPGDLDAALLAALAGSDASVAEVAAWALGERHEAAEHPTTTTQTVVAALISTVNSHADALCRESAVAALGAIGHEDGLAAILRATSDKTTVRRRAIIALASYDGPEVDAALAHALEDRDWQVRQAAEDLSSITDDGP